MRDGLGGVQSVLLLGGTSDIGQEIVRRLVDDGAHGGPRRPPVRAPGGVRLELTDRGATSVQTADFDAADTASHATLVNRLFDESPDLDVVIQAFGVLGDQEDFDRDPQAAAEAVSVLLGFISTGPRWPSASPAGPRDARGALLGCGRPGAPGNFVYGSSKAGQDGFAQGSAARSSTPAGRSSWCVRASSTRP